MENNNTSRNDPSKGKYHNSPPPWKPPITFAAMQNLTPEFFAVLDDLGLEVVVVRFEAGKDSPVWKHDKVEEDLGRQLMAVEAGDFDSSAFIEGVIYHFYHVSDLGKAMQTLKDAIESLGLLAITMIFHAESASELRVYYPPQDPENQVAKI